jgi:transcriptional regulator with XRE-family HTH domain
MASCSKLSRSRFEARNFALDAGVFPRKRAFNPCRRPVAISHQAYVAAADPELPRNATLDVSGEFRSESAGVHISCEATEVCFEGSRYDCGHPDVKEKMSKAINSSSGATLAGKIYALRKGLRLKQAELAAICGVDQSAVSQWESERPNRVSVPSAKILVKLSELAPESERQWWRDQAAEQVGIGLQDIDVMGTYMANNLLRTIPLFKKDKGGDVVGSYPSSDVERHLHFPAEWFPEGGNIRALRVLGEGAPEMIAMVDLSRRDADRLVAHMVAVQTPSGLEVRWLSKQDGAYILLPFQPGQALRMLRPHGENSIVGLVRWIGDALDAPPKKGRTQ